MTWFLQKILRLPLHRKVLLIQVSLQLILIHVGLRLFSFSTFYRFLKRYHRAPGLSNPNPTQRENICWAVNRAGKVLFANHGCLTQALLGETLLVRKGIPARLCIGVSRQPDGAMLAHAWVESDDQVVIGGMTRQKLKEFQNLPNLNQVLNNPPQ